MSGTDSKDGSPYTQASLVDILSSTTDYTQLHYPTSFDVALRLLRQIHQEFQLPETPTKNPRSYIEYSHANDVLVSHSTQEQVNTTLYFALLAIIAQLTPELEEQGELLWYFLADSFSSEIDENDPRFLLFATLAECETAIEKMVRSGIAARRYQKVVKMDYYIFEPTGNDLGDFIVNMWAKLMPTKIKALIIDNPDFFIDVHHVADQHGLNRPYLLFGNRSLPDYDALYQKRVQEAEHYITSDE